MLLLSILQGTTAVLCSSETGIQTKSESFVGRCPTCQANILSFYILLAFICIDVQGQH